MCPVSEIELLLKPLDDAASFVRTITCREHDVEIDVACICLYGCKERLSRNQKKAKYLERIVSFENSNFISFVVST
ncbi:hypothetical protein GJ496_000143 [Pomphorhynchus laevis]|nr:hypothetical protein GJ496_000143 [Pomphorhynchus laevis]